MRVDHPEPGADGLVSTGLDRQLGPEDLVLALIGYLADPEPGIGWPPAWPPRRDSDVKDEHGAAILVEHLGLTEERYLELIRVAEELLATEAFQRLVALVASALMRIRLAQAARLCAVISL